MAYLRQELVRATHHQGQRSAKVYDHGCGTALFAHTNIIILFIVLYCVHVWPVWLNGRAFARDPKGRGFESRPVCFQVAALGKLLTLMCLCHQAV